MSGRRYDEREVGQILRRVAELHEREDRADPRSMSVAEIEEVVGELGISKALVAQAARELSVADHRNKPVWWLGGKGELMFEEVVEGRVDEATLTRMIEALRRELGDPGTLSEQGASRVWSTGEGTSRRVHFTVVEDGERTTLRLEERMPVDARTTVGGSTVGGGVTGFMLTVPLKALILKSTLLLLMGPLAVVGAALGWLVGRALWRRVSDRREAQLRRAFAEALALAEAKPKALE